MGKMKKTLLVGLAGLLLIAGAAGCTKDAKKQEEKSNSAVEKIKTLQTNGDVKEFENLMVVNMQTLQSHTGLTSAEVETVFGQLPTDVDSTFYLAIKPKSGDSKFGGTNKDRVKKLMSSYIDSLKTRLSSELPMTTDTEEEVDEVEKARREAVQKKVDMLNNMKIEESKGYIIYVSSSDNSKVLSEIKKGL